MTRVFLSYAGEDRELARRLAEFLHVHGCATWWDRNLHAGAHWRHELRSALEQASCVVVLWSRASVASQWVDAEAYDGWERGILVPAILDDAKVPLEYRSLQTADLREWHGEPEHAGVQKLLDDVRARVGATPPAPPETRAAAVPADAAPCMMYAGGVTFFINKQFGSLQMVPEPAGLRLVYIPVRDGKEDPTLPGHANIVLPLDAVGGIWATTRAFLHGVESLDENVILYHPSRRESDILIKLYRDKPRGEDGRLTGEETTWLRLVTGQEEEERRRIKLGPRDLLCLDLACQAVLHLAAEAGTHRPVPYDPPPEAQGDGA